MATRTCLGKQALFVVVLLACGTEVVPAGNSASSGGASTTTSATGYSTGNDGSSGSSGSTVTPTSTSTVGQTESGSGSTQTEASTGANGTCSRIHEGNLYVLADTDLASLADLGSVTEGLYISMGERDQYDLEFLKCLHTVGKGLHITGNNLLESTAGVESLQSIGGLWITQNGSLREILGFDQIQDLAVLEVSGNPKLEEIHLDSIQTVGHLQIGYCESEMAAAYHLALVNLTGFGGLVAVERLGIDGNEALLTADLLDALSVNGEPVPIEQAWIRFNPLLSEADVHTKLDVLGVQDREVCGNKEGAQGCFCLVGD